VSERAFRAGDDVRWREGWSRHGKLVYGTVKRAGAKSITLTPESGIGHVVLRRQRYGQPWKSLEYVSPESMALLRWIVKRPTTTVHAYWDARGSADDHRLDIGIGRVVTPEDLDRVVADLTVLRAWLAERPAP
jgi:hypothetical protein